MLINNMMESGDVISVEFSYEGNNLIADAKMTDNDYVLTKRFSSEAAEMISAILSSPDMEKGGVTADYFHKDRKRYIKKPEIKIDYDREITLDESTID